MKVLITGATGLIGTELVKNYLTRRVIVNFLTTNKSKVNKIQGAKGFYWNPSTNNIDLSLKKLKEGFKKIYGKPVYQYLLEHKMELAKKLLSENSYNVNEVSIKLGYSTASHFITAFKNKYGLTPKNFKKNY